MEEQDNIETNLKTCAEKHCDHLVTRFYGRSGIIYEQCVKKHCKQDDRPDSPPFIRRGKARIAKRKTRKPAGGILADTCAEEFGAGAFWGRT